MRRWQRVRRGLGLRLYLNELEGRVAQAEDRLADLRAELTYCRDVVDRTYRVQPEPELDLRLPRRPA